MRLTAQCFLLVGHRWGKALTWYVPLGVKAWFDSEGIKGKQVVELDWWQVGCDTCAGVQRSLHSLCVCMRIGDLEQLGASGLWHTGHPDCNEAERKGRFLCSTLCTHGS